MKSKQKKASEGAGGVNSSRRAVFARIRRSVVAVVKAPAVTPGQTFDFKQIFIAGSGFFVEKSGLVITAGHVVDPWLKEIENAKIAGVTPEMPQVLWHGPVTKVGDQTTWGYFLAPVARIYRASAFDLAVLTTSVNGDAAKSICTVDFAPSHCLEGDHVATCGYRFGMELHAQVLGGIPAIIPSFAQGVVSALLPHNEVAAKLQKRFQIHAMISGGNSGGPVFEPHTGRVVGVITNSLTTTVEGVVARQVPKDANGAPLGAPVENSINVSFPIGLALAEHGHHVQTVIAEARAAESKPSGP